MRRAAPLIIRRRDDRRSLFGMAGLGLIVGLLAVAPARSEVRLNHETGGNFQVSVMSWWDIPFRSVVRQRYDFSCGSAAVATLLSYHYDRPTPERLAFAQMWKTGDREAIRKVGFSMFDMKSYLDSIGFEAEGFRISVDQLKGLKRPVIVLLDLKGFKHFVVVKGARGDRILVGDPMLGLSQYSAEDFKKIWNGIALAIVRTPGEEKPGFDLAGDWGPGSTAPLEDGALRVAASDLTTHLPPSYQLAPQILLDVRVGTVR